MPSCTGDLEWDTDEETQRGLAWIVRVKCTDCEYTSEKEKLFLEVQTGKRGRKAATINYGLQVGLSHTSISGTSMSNILLAMNTPTPSVRGMQQTANIVGDKIIAENKEDMKKVRSHLAKVNTLKGLPADAPINIECDAR